MKALAACTQADSLDSFLLVIKILLSYNMLAKMTSMVLLSTALKYSVRFLLLGMLGRWKDEGVAAVNTFWSHWTWKTNPGKGMRAECTLLRKLGSWPGKRYCSGFFYHHQFRLWVHRIFQGYYANLIYYLWIILGTTMPYSNACLQYAFWSALWWRLFLTITKWNMKGTVQIYWM